MVTNGAKQMKLKKLYSVRYYANATSYSKAVGFKHRLMPRDNALRIARFLKARGVHAYVHPMMVAP